MFLDATGKACPIPVVMAKRELDGGCEDLIIAVDNDTAVQNLTRLASGRQMQAETQEQDGVFRVRIHGASSGPALMPPLASCGSGQGGYAVFISKDHLGEGAQELGYNLLRMALFTLAQGEALPESVLFMNSGVRLPAGEDEQVLDSLRALSDKGVDILVCGTCLNYYGITEQLKAGAVSNMYDILERMQRAGKVITL